MPGERVDVEREIVVPAEPDEVWESLTDPERLEEWFASEVELDARPGGEGVFRWGDGDERRVVVRDIDRDRFLAPEEAVEYGLADSVLASRNGDAAG